ncbi:hypothetical protein EV426DRAFT_674535 [Tirmania nivea]|nr:hypothetical protein EV426DRAFT_674535 [Tirmania nivea]
MPRKESAKEWTNSSAYSMDEEEEESYVNEVLYQKMYERKLEEEMKRELDFEDLQNLENDWDEVLEEEQCQERARQYLEKGEFLCAQNAVVKISSRMETSKLTSHPGFSFSVDPTKFVPVLHTQSEATVIGSSAPLDELLPTQARRLLIQARSVQVDNITTKSVTTPQARYLIDFEKETGGEIRKAVQKETNRQYDGLVEAFIVHREGFATTPSKASKGETESPVKSKDSLDFLHIDSLFQGCSEEEYIGYIVDAAAGKYEGSSEDSNDLMILD